MDRLTDHLNMTIVVDWDVKQQTNNYISHFVMMMDGFYVTFNSSHFVMMMDGFYVTFNSISVILGQWKGEHERLCA